MSGFVAIVNTNGAPVDRTVLEQLTTALKCRGPDRQQVWTDGPVGLGHTLFRTTHEAQYENQPASIDGKVWITGCIRVDARETLVAALGLDTPLSLERTPDSELVLHAYHTWGERCLDHLLGDFAFALWDGHKQRLFCARDRFGMRQLYHARVGSACVISNSLHCMRQYPGISDALDERAIADFLLFGDHIWTDKSRTAFKDTKTLPPAHYLTQSGSTTRISRYWDLPDDIPLLSCAHEDEYLEQFHAVFRQAVADRLRCQGAVIAMSGGMDSSSIAATAHAIRKGQGHDFRLQALSIASDTVHPSRERHYSGLVADHLNLPIHYIAADNYPALTPALRWTRPREYYRPGLWLDFNRQAMAFGRVLLTGQAGDNLLQYSPSLPTAAEANPLRTLRQIIQLRTHYGHMPGLGTGLKARARRLFGKNGVKPPPYPFPTWLNHDLESRFDMPERWHAFWASYTASPKGRSRHPRLYHSLILPGWNTDDVEMSGDLTLPEQRDPYLDLRLVEFVLSLPPMPWLFEKHILRQSMRSALPVAVIERPKQVLGALASSLSEQPHVTEYSSGGALVEYVDEAAWRKATARRGGAGLDYVNLRPIILGQWLQTL